MSNNFMKIYNEHTRTSEFLEFMENKCFSTYMFLRGSIIRESDYVTNGKALKTDAYRIYHTYFKKNKLVSHYAMSTMGKYFNKTKSVISKRIKELEEKGFIKIHKYMTKDGVNYDYEIGYYTGKYGTDDYKEYYYMDNYFDKVYEKERTKKEEEKFNLNFADLDSNDEIVEDDYIDTDKLKFIEIKPGTTLRDVISLFDDPKKYLEFRMYKEGRAITEEAAKQHYKNWYAVHNTVSY